MASNCAWSSGHSGPKPLSASWQAGREAIPGVDALALLGDEAGLLQHAEVARHARLRETEDAGELRDVQPLGRQQPQEAQPGVVSQQTVEGAAQLHIY